MSKISVSIRLRKGYGAFEVKVRLPMESGKLRDLLDFLEDGKPTRCMVIHNRHRVNTAPLRDHFVITDRKAIEELNDRLIFINQDFNWDNLDKKIAMSYLSGNYYELANMDFENMHLFTIENIDELGSAWAHFIKRDIKDTNHGEIVHQFLCGTFTPLGYIFYYKKG